MARAAPAASRAAGIVSFLTAHPSRGFTISELAAHLSMNIASAHATLAVLCDAGYTVRDPVHRTYVLGPALTVTGFAAAEQHPAVGAAIEQAALLAAEVDAEVGVSALAGTDLIFLARRGPVPGEPVTGYPGDRSPLLAPFGAVFMAWADEAAVDAWLHRAAVPASTVRTYREVLDEIRERGFSVPMRPIATPAIASAVERIREEPADASRETELTEALRGVPEALVPMVTLAPDTPIRYTTVTAPIFDPMGRVLLSLSISGPDEPVPLQRVLELGRRLARSASVATRQARGRPPVR